MKNEIENENENVKIILEFRISENNIDNIDIDCNYKAENSQSSKSFKDSNILEKWKKEGLSLFVDSLN